MPLWHIDVTGTGSGPITLANATTGETATLGLTSSALATPSAPTLAVLTGSTPVSTAGTYYVVFAYIDATGGFGPVSSETAQTITNVQLVQIFGPAASTGALSVAIYASMVSGGPYFYFTAPALAGFGPLNSIVLSDPSFWGGQLVPTGYTSGDAIELDRDGYTVTVNDAPLFNLFDGEIPRLVPGANDITLTAGGTATVGALQIIYAPRYA